MKKLSLLIILSIVSLFVGCGSEKVKPIDLDKVYTCVVEISDGDFNTTANLERLDGKNWRIVFQTPETMTDVVVNLKNDVADVSYKGLEFSLNRTEIPVNAMISTITNVLDGVAMGQNLKFLKNGSDISVSGKIENASYNLKVDKKGTLLELSIPSQDIFVKFSEFKITK